MKRGADYSEAYRIAGLQPSDSSADANGHGDHREFRHTDLGNAEWLVESEGGDLHYVYDWRRWLVQDGKRWKPDNTGEIVRRAKSSAKAMYHAADPAGGAPIDRALAKHAIKSESKSSIEAMIALAQSEPGIPVVPDQLDRDPWLLNVSNGTIDLRTGKLREHRREDLITKLAPVEYHPEAEAPTWEAFLERILPSEDLRRFVQRAIGYAAAGVVSEEVLIILHGTGDNGKTTLINAIMEALGDYAIQAARDLLLAKGTSTHPTELTDLFGARFVACSETDDGRRLAEALVKQLTGRERIRARGMRQDFWEFDPTHTVFLSTNHRPEVRGTDHAIWRRLKLVPFEVKIPEAEKDKNLQEKLRAELPGILAWIVRGCLEYQRDGLGRPAEVEEATQSYRAEMDVLAGFIEDRCVVQPRTSAGATPLYNAYKDWCENTGEVKLTQTKFGRRLKERGFRSEKTQRVTWYGIGLRDDRPDPAGGLGNDPRPDDESADSSGGDQGAPAHSDGSDSGSNPLTVDSSEQNHLSGESSLDKPDAADASRELREFRPGSNISGLENTRVGLISETGLQLSKPSKPSSDEQRVDPLSAEEVQRVRELERQGMSAKIARAEVLQRRKRGK